VIDGRVGHLFDPQGDLRAWMIYPCKIACTNPAQGQIALNAQPRKDEWISITNTGSTLDMEPYALKTPPYSYAFPAGTVLGPGQTIRVHTEGDPAEDGATDKYWGMTGQILNNGGDVATLSTYNDIQIACTAYGSKSC
jgi:Lamin Tail Domain